MLCLDSQGSPFTIHVSPGIRFRGIQSPTVRVFLAHGTDDEVDAYLADGTNLEGPGPLTRKDVALFRKKVNAARDNGYDYEDDAHGYGASGLSAPVMDYSGSIVAVMTLILPSSRMQNPPRKDYLQALMQAAAEVSEALGYSPEE